MCGSLAAPFVILCRSKFDHVAMIIRKWDNSLVVLESTTDGVTVYKYDGRLSARTRCAFAIRRLLRVERTAAMRKTVWDFVTSVRGKPYESQTLQMVRL